MKFDKRRLLGPLFKPLSTLKHSRASRIFVSALWLPSQLLRARRNRPYFAVDISSTKGMGAVISEAVLMCHYAHVNGLVPRIISTNPLYATRPGRDFLGDYLGPEDVDGGPGLRPMRYRTLFSFMHLDFTQHVPLAEASRLFWTYFPPKRTIRDRVDAVLDRVPGRRFDLSIHYRGTDKALEAKLVAFDVYERAVLEHLAAGGCLQTVFLATDDGKFESFIRRRFPDTTFETFNLGSAVDASRGRHFSDLSPSDKATESLVNMFLLAAAPKCIRGASYMSGVSKIINPELATVTLTRTHWGSSEFPEHEILAAENLACPPRADHRSS